MGFSKRKYTGKKTYRKTYVPKSVKRYVSRAIDNSNEDKCTYIRLNDIFNSVGSAWVEQIISDPAQGVAKNQRIGQRIKMKSVEIRGVLAQGSNQSGITDDAWNVMRIVVARFGAGANFTPLQSAGQNINDPISKSFFNQNGRLLHKYLDKYIGLEVASTEKGAGDGYTPTLRQFKYYKKFNKPLFVNWNDNSVNNPSQGLYLSMISDSGAVVNPGFLNGYMLFRYEDA